MPRSRLVEAGSRVPSTRSNLQCHEASIKLVARHKARADDYKRNFIIKIAEVYDGWKGGRLSLFDIKIGALGTPIIPNQCG